jgi:transcriptional regulator with XRE-family HTH domain
MSTGNALFRLRKRRKMTQKELALRVGMDPGQLCRYELGIVCPHVKTLKRLADGLGVRISDLAR